MRIRLINGPLSGTLIQADPITLQGLIINGEVYVSDQKNYMGVSQYVYIGKLEEDEQ